MTSSISDSGGYEGSNQTLTLESTKGSILHFYYEHYTIPDRFMIIYGGVVYFDSGFVGGNYSGEIELPAGGTDLVQVIVATDDEGTEWYYDVEASSNDTYPFILKANGSDFTEDSAGATTYHGSGTITIGREDGINRLITVGSATGSYDEDSFTVSGSYSFDIGGISTVIFSGEFSTSFDSGYGTVTESGSDGLKLGNIDVEVHSMKVRASSIEIGVDFVLPTELGDLRVDDKSLVFTSSGVMLGATGKVELADASFTFLKLFEVSAADQVLSYDSTQNYLKYQGEITIEGFSKFFKNQSLTLDLTGKNYVGIGTNGVDFIGTLSYDNTSKFTSWGLKHVEISVDTKAQTVSGSVTVVLPTKMEVTGTVAFIVTPSHHLDMNEVTVGLQNVNRPLPFAPSLYLQSIEGSLKHISQSDSELITLEGNIELTGLAKVGKASIAQIDISGKLDENHVEGTADMTFLNSNVVSAHGHLNLDWNAGFLTLDGTVNFFSGALTASANLKLTRDLDFTLSGHQELHLSALGMTLDQTADFIVSFTNNGNSADDYLAGWATVSFLGYEKTIGIRYGFNGSHSLLGADEIPTGTSSMPVVSAAMAADAADAAPSLLYLIAAWTNATSNTIELQVQDAQGNIIHEADFAAHGIDILEELGSTTGRVVAITDPGSTNWTLTVVDTTGLGDVTYTAAVEGKEATLAVDVGSNVGGFVDISYSMTDFYPDSTISFYADVDGDGLDGLLIATLDAGTDVSGVYHWDARGMVPGTYHIYGVLQSETAVPVTDYADATVAVTDSTDLQITVSGPDKIVLGEQATFTLTVTNNGTIDAANVSIDDLLPDAWKYVSSSLSPSETGDGHVYFQLSSVAAGETVEITLVLEQMQPNVTIAADAGNISIATAESLDDHFKRAIDQNVEGSDTGEHVSVFGTGNGAPAYYAFTVAGDGDQLIFDIDQTVGFDSYIRIWDADGKQIAYNDDSRDAVRDAGSSTSYDSKLAYTFATAGTYYISVSQYSSVNVDAGDTYRLNITRPTENTGSTFTNTATVSASTHDPEALNNTDIVITTIGDVSETDGALSLSATDFVTTVAVGGMVTSTVTVTNDGLADVANIKLTSLFSSILGDIDIDTSMGYASTSDTGFEVDIDTLAAGESVTITFSGTTRGAGSFTADLSLTSDAKEADYTDNEVSISTSVQPVSQSPADLDLSFDVSQRDDDGRQIVVITLANEGPGVANAIEVTIPQVPGLTIYDYDLLQGTFDASTGVWSIGNVRDGISRELTLVIDAGSTSIAQLTAEISKAATTDPDSTPGNGVATEDDFASAYITLGQLTEVPGTDNGETLPGTDAAEVFHAGGGADIVNAGDGADAIYGGDGNDQLFGQDGDDWLFGQGGNDTIDGGNGSDTVVFTGVYADYEIVDNGDGSFTVTDKKGTDGSDVIRGTEFWKFADVTRAAGDVNDAPTDIQLSPNLIAENSAAGTVVGTLTATDPDTGDVLTFSLSDDADGTFAISDNKIVLAASAALDFETTSAYSIIVKATDSGGLSVEKRIAIDIGDVNETPISIDLSNQAVAENAAIDSVVGALSGIDPDGDVLTWSLDDSSGAFKLVTTGGVTNLVVAKALDYETAQSYVVTLTASDGEFSISKDYTIEIGDVVDQIKGDGKANVLTGADGADIIQGLGGNDILYGHGGADKLYGNGGKDMLVGGEGADLLSGGGGSDTASYADASVGLTASLIKPSVNSADAKGDVYSSIENLTGTAFADRLYGDAKANILTGGAGADKLYGGAGKDTFVFKTGDSGLTSTTADTIFDFTSADRIDLRGWDANSRKGGVQDFHFIGTQAFTGHAGDLHYVKQKSDTWIEGDTNGDRKADFIIHLDDAVTLRAGEFVL